MTLQTIYLLCVCLFREAYVELVCDQGALDGEENLTTTGDSGVMLHYVSHAIFFGCAGISASTTVITPCAADLYTSTEEIRKVVVRTGHSIFAVYDYHWGNSKS